MVARGERRGARGDLGDRARHTRVPETGYPPRVGRISPHKEELDARFPTVTDLRWLDGWAQAELLARGEASAAELVDAAIDRIEAYNPALNAVITPLFEQARERAGAAEALGHPFRGVPFLLKDLGANEAGFPYYAGNAALRDAGYRSPADTPLGARFRDAGLVPLGKTNASEFGAQTTTQPLAFGPTRNPWDLERSTSGSSGGSAAAVAAGLVPLAHANDGGGSIRLPAAWCGLVGLKPSRGRVPMGPGAVNRIVCELGVTRSVRDAALLLDAVAGDAPGVLFAAPRAERPFVSALEGDPPPLRIGWMTDIIEATTDPACEAAVVATAQTLERLGHRIEASFPAALLDEERRPRTAALARASFRYTLRTLAQMLGREVQEKDVEPYLWGLAEWDQPAVGSDDYLAASEWLQRWVERVCAWWVDGPDLLLTPTVCTPAVRLSDMTPPADAPYKVAGVRAQLAFTQPFNYTGQPAISLPLHETDSGLPVGAQLVAAYGREDLLLRVAAQLERAMPWARRRPRTAELST